MVRLFNWCFYSLTSGIGSTLSLNNYLNINKYPKQYNIEHKYQKYHCDYKTYPIIKLRPNILEFDGFIIVGGKIINLPFYCVKADDIEIDNNCVTIKVNNNGIMWEAVIGV